MRPFKTMLLCAALGTGTVACLQILMLWRDHPASGFSRVFRTDFILRATITDINENGYYIAGVNDTAVFFGNSELQNRILMMNVDLTTQKISTIKTRWAFNWPYVEVREAAGSLMLSDRTHNWIATTMAGKDDTLDVVALSKSFIAAYPLTKSRAAVAVIDSINRQFDLAIFSSSHSEMIPAHVLERQAEGYFSVDGMLVATPSPNRFLYAYYYRNQVLVLDSSLALVSMFSTIDTTTRMDGNIGKIRNGAFETFSGPPPVVSKRICASDQYIFIESASRALNETKHDFESHIAIDVYDILSYRYKFSFYIPPLEGQSITSMTLSGSRFIVTYKTHFAGVYKLRL